METNVHFCAALVVMSFYYPSLFYGYFFFGWTTDALGVGGCWWEDFNLLLTWFFILKHGKYVYLQRNCQTRKKVKT